MYQYFRILFYQKLKLTYKLYGFSKPDQDILVVSVLDRDNFVQVFRGEQTLAGVRHIQDGSDTDLVQNVLVTGMLLVTNEKMWQEFGWLALKNGQMTPINLEIVERA